MRSACLCGVGVRAASVGVVKPLCRASTSSRMWWALFMASPVGGVSDGADHPEATAGVPSPIGVTRLGGDREQRLLHTPSLRLCWGPLEQFGLPLARRLSEALGFSSENLEHASCIGRLRLDRYLLFEVPYVLPDTPTAVVN